MTRVGSIELEVPRLRTGRFSTELFDRYQRSEQALVLDDGDGGQWGVHAQGEADH